MPILSALGNCLVSPHSNSGLYIRGCNDQRLDFPKAAQREGSVMAGTVGQGKH
jgi:hypothetical protein